MRELYNEFFYIPKHGKIREKVMLTRIVTTITIVIMCLAAMSITAYAYFSYNVTSGSNTIKAASFYIDVAVQITDADGKAVDNSQITPITSDYKSFRIEDLEVGKYYTVTITHTERSTAQTGFVVVTADYCKDTFHTQQLAKDVNAEGGETPSISFKLMITEKTNVHLLAHWGTSSYYDAYKDKGDQEKLYITQGEEIIMIVNGTEPSSGDEGNGDISDTPGNTSEGTGETPATPSTDTTTPTTGGSTGGESSTPTQDSTTPTTDTTTPTTETTTPETTGTEETTTTTEPETQTTEPAATETANTEETTETQPATENAETTGAPTTEASE